MIVTVTMNPALDKTAEVVQLLPGELNRLENVRVDAGGKGVNVSKMISVLGGHSVCTGFVGGESGRELCRRLDEMAIPNDFIPTSGATRTNLKVVDSQRNLTELNEPGIRVTDAEFELLLDKIHSLAGKRGIVVLGGSLPLEADADTYLHFTSELRKAGCTVLVDADGNAFHEALKAPPHIIKPNRFELLQYYNLPDNTPDSTLPSLCLPLLEKGVTMVALSMGKDGAMFFTKEQSAKAKALPVDAHSTVGAGDSMVGALAYSLENKLNFEETVRLAMACSIGAVTTMGTNPPGLDLVRNLTPQIQIESL